MIASSTSEGVAPGSFNTRLLASVDIRSIQTNLLYPNPTTSDFSIETNQTLRSVSIYSSSGKIIHSWQSPGKDAVFQLSDLKNGTYIVKIESDGNETEYLRLLKAAVR
ncbi:MAG: T9SS type A sorting domain-containing protein [Bacteroidota bacterium]